ncbi:MAG: group 1 truncated hemoglobin [Gammaproteobacteria bacterium]|nr:group 1 truncated hemoglobin [Gammaproteobacteria bacterium]
MNLPISIKTFLAKCRLTLVCTLAIAFIGCAGKEPKVTLYQQMGSQQGINQLVDQLIIKIGNDNQIFHYFAKANVTHFRKGLVQHFCAVADGPCRYEGDSMKQIHTGMNINEKDFNHLVELLIEVMNELNYSTGVQNQLLKRLAPMRENIIYI